LSLAAPTANSRLARDSDQRRLEVAAERRRSGKIVAPLLLLMLAVVHAPRQAQALVSSFFPDIFPLATSEPVMLLLTGLALISLASVGSNRPR
jgi:hypothetical protein